MRQMARLLLLLALTASPWLPAQAANPSTARGFLAETIHIGDADYPYVLYVPRDYQPETRWPLIVFLHGAGECGTDGLLQLAAGLPPAIVKRPGNWPFLVLIPQKPDRRSAWEDHDAALMAMLERTQHDYAVDDRQRFLTGLSQGGHGTWVLGARHKELWAAIAPVCGYGDPQAIGKDLATMPLWAFHGDADKAVSVQQSKALVAAVQAAGGKPELLIYPGVGHNSWDQAYGEAGLADWFLGQATERIVRQALASPEALQRARIELRAVGPTAAGPGTAVWCLAFADGTTTWTAASQSIATDRQPDPAPRSGRLPGAAELRQQLLQLLDGGALRLPRRRPNAPGMLEAQHTLTLTVELDDSSGPFAWRRTVPVRDQDGARAAVDCLWRFARSFDQLK